MEEYLKIPTLFILTSKNDVTFNIYIKQQNCFILYSTPEKFTKDQRQKLYDIGVEYLYISNKDKITYNEYIEQNLHHILDDNTIPIKKKQTILYENALEVVNNIFNKSKIDYIEKTSFKQIYNIIGNVFDFVIDKHNGLQSIQKIIKINYKDYVHALNTSVYTMALYIHHHNYNSLQKPTQASIKRLGVSALLHDIGKSEIPIEILNKKSELNDKEWEIIKKHPIYSLEKCQNMNLNSELTSAVLFHHEKLDGSGYPTGTKNIKDTTQMITISDMYDAMTTERPFREFIHTPFKSLKLLSNDAEKNKLNKDIVKSFIQMISTNQFSK